MFQGYVGNFLWLMVGLGPGGLDSDWIPGNGTLRKTYERRCDQVKICITLFSHSSLL